MNRIQAKPLTHADSRVLAGCVTQFAIISLVCWLAVFAKSALGQCYPRWEFAGGVPGVDGVVNAIARSPNNDIVVAGWFYRAGNTLCNNISRWDNVRDEWTSLGAGLCGTAYSMCQLPNGDIVVGGDFVSAGDQVVNNVARWNGSAWVPMGSGLGAMFTPIQAVRALAVLPNGDVIAGGFFTAIGDVPVSHIARWDGTAWSAMGDGLEGSVYAIAVRQNGEVLAGGQFNLDESRCDYVMRWDGSTWQPIASGVANIVYALQTLRSGNVVAAGHFSISTTGGVARNIASWNGTQWSRLGEGIGFAGLSFEQTGVRSLAESPSGEVIAGGYFGISSMYKTCCRWNGTAWNSLGGSLFGRDFLSVNALAIQGNDVIVGGFFDHSSTDVVNSIARTSANGLVPMGRCFNKNALTLASLSNGHVIVGGSFDSIGGIAAGRIARWDGVNWYPFANGLGDPSSSTTYALSVLSNDVILAGGSFFVSSNPFHFASWNGSSWSTRLASGPVRAFLPIQNNEYLAAGGAQVYRVVNSLWTPLGPPVGTVELNALALLPNGNVVAGGNLRLGGSASHIAQWDGVSWSSIGGGVNNEVYAFDVLPDGRLIAGGTFGLAGETPVMNVAQWDGSAWSAIGAGLDAAVHSLAHTPNGEIVAGGAFRNSGTTRVYQIAKWDGLAWGRVGYYPGYGPSDVVRAVKILSNGDIVIAGSISPNGLNRYVVGRYSSNGIEPEVALQPVAARTCVGSIATFKAAASSSDAGFTWLYRFPDSESWHFVFDGPILDESGTEVAVLRGVYSPVLVVEVRSPSLDNNVVCYWKCSIGNNCTAIDSDIVALTVCRADLNCDSIADFADYLDFIDAFSRGDIRAEFNRDSVIDLFDYLDFVQALAGGC